MPAFRNKLFVIETVGVLGVVGTLMNSRNATAAGGPTVSISDPLPLPVTITGNNTITGTVALATGSSVRVNNSLTDPVHAKIVPSETPFFQSSPPTCDAVNRCFVSFPAVPTLKRLRVKRIHGAFFFTNVDAFVALDLNNTNGQLFVQQLHPFSGAYLGTVLSFNEATDVVFTAGQVPIVEIGTAGTFAPSSFNRLGITGDLEDIQ